MAVVVGPRPRGPRLFPILAMLAAMSLGAIARDLPSQITASAAWPETISELILDELPPATAAPSWSWTVPELRRRDGKQDDDSDSDSDGDAPATTTTTTSEHHHHDDASDTETASVATATGSQTLTRATRGSKTDTAASLTAVASPLPSAFDGVQKSDFGDSEDTSNSCPSFVGSLLSNPQFKKCYPLSMMVQTSIGLFNAEKSLASIARVLDASCDVDVDTCAQFMDEAAKNLTQTAHCQQEYKKGLSTVMNAYTGLAAYKVLYTAACLKDKSHSQHQYCFANAVTNRTQPSDAFLYYLPFNLSLPGASTVSCSWCTSQTMGIFHSSSADRRLLISDTYELAATQINTLCGVNFVNSTLPEATIESAASIATPLLSWTVFFLLTIALLNVAV